MKANVIITPNFQREAKKLIKKFQSLKSELLELAEELEENPRMGNSSLEFLINEVQTEIQQQKETSTEEE